MIAHVTGAGSFSRLADYLANGVGDATPDRVLWVEPRGGASPDLDEAASEMEDVARYSGRVETPGIHLTVAFDPDDRVGKEEMVAVADEVKRAMGLGELMSVIVAHGDAYYPHFHEMICRVDYWTGKAATPRFPYYHVEKRLRELERSMGLAETPGKHGRLEGQTFERKHDGRWLSAEERKYVRAALRSSGSWGDLEGRLSARGLGIRIDRHNLILVRGPFSVGAGRIQPGSSLKKMEKRMGQRLAEYALSMRASIGFSHSEGGAPVTEEGMAELKAGAGLAGAEVSGVEADGVASRAVADVLRLADELVRIEQEQKAAAEAVEGLSRIELWEGRLQELAGRADATTRAMGETLREVFEEPELAGARFEKYGAVEGGRAAVEKLLERPGAFGTPTKKGRGEEGGLLLLEAAEKGAAYFALLEETGALWRALRNRGFETSAEAGDRMDRVGGRSGPLPRVLAGELAILREAILRERLGGADPLGLYREHKRIETTIRKALDGLSEEERRKLRREIGKREIGRERGPEKELFEKKLLELMTPRRVRARGGMGR